MYDPLREAHELREQLSSDRRRIAFLFGAGTSQAVGLPGIATLTKAVRSRLTGDDLNHYNRLLAEAGTDANVEHVLDKIRLCRELIGESADYEAGGLKGGSATQLDRAVCSAIFSIVNGEPPGGVAPHIRFANWARFIRRDCPIEVFTTNYDVLIERGLEATETAHFDGFIGSVTPYFSNVTVEADGSKAYEPVYPPRSWVRVWKLHGSIGWRVVKDPTTSTDRIIRTYASMPKSTDDLLIFPSRQKYSDSRKLPFVAYHDRLRKLLSSGETLLVINGYSFGDQHINEIIVEALRNNPRLAVAALMYEPLSTSTSVIKPVTFGRNFRNLSVYGPDQACIGGVLAKWALPSRPPVSPLTKWPFWDDAGKTFILGNFSAFTEYLTIFFTASDFSGATASPATPAPPLT